MLLTNFTPNHIAYRINQYSNHKKHFESYSSFSNLACTALATSALIYKYQLLSILRIKKL
jgi:predicted metalloenzyme YecM